MKGMASYMASMNQNLRTLYLMDIMLEYTDENHTLSATEISMILKNQYTMSISRPTIYAELEVLKRYGLDIQQNKGRNPGYYIGSRLFEIAELKLLVDAVQSSKFITENKSRVLISKLEKLCCKPSGGLLQKQVFILKRTKNENETIYYNVDHIHTAICENREISFQYSEWTMKKELQLKKAGAQYVVSPWALTWNDENYYLVAYDASLGEIRHYRVDKMQRTIVLESNRKGKRIFDDFNLPEYMKKTFGMYGGIDTEVEFICAKELVGVIIDRFGREVWMVPKGDMYFKSRVLIAVSPQFFGWVAGLGKNIQIIGPEYVKRQYQEYLQDILQQYNE